VSPGLVLGAKDFFAQVLLDAIQVFRQ